MSGLTFLGDACVLWNSVVRYKNELIYTYSGLFCIAINPYKRFPIYTQRAMEIFIGKRSNNCLFSFVNIITPACIDFIVVFMQPLFKWVLCHPEAFVVIFAFKVKTSIKTWRSLPSISHSCCINHLTVA